MPRAPEMRGELVDRIAGPALVDAHDHFVSRVLGVARQRHAFSGPFRSADSGPSVERSSGPAATRGSARARKAAGPGAAYPFRDSPFRRRLSKAAPRRRRAPEGMAGATCETVRP